MRVAVMGAGGIGAYVGGRLAAAGEDVAFIARGRQLDAMRSTGLRLESPLGNIHLTSINASDRPADVGPVDLVLFTVKLWDTDTAALALAPLIAPHTRVLSLQNGIDSVDLIARRVPREQVVGGVIYVVAHVVEPGFIRSPGGISRMVVDGKAGDAVIMGLQTASTRARGLGLELTDNISAAIWEKFVRLSAFSAATSLIRSTCGPILANRESRELIRLLLDEAIMVAAATGNRVRKGFAEESMSLFDRLPEGARASMAEDLDHGRRLELPWLSGRVHALGIAHRVPTPAHSTVYRALSLYANGVGKN